MSISRRHPYRVTNTNVVQIQLFSPDDGHMNAHQQTRRHPYRVTNTNVVQIQQFSPENGHVNAQNM